MSTTAIVIVSMLITATPLCWLLLHSEKHRSGPPGLRPSVMALIDAFETGPIEYRRLDRTGICELRVRVRNGSIATITWYTPGRLRSFIFMDSQYSFETDELEFILGAALRRTKGLFLEETAKLDTLFKDQP